MGERSVPRVAEGCDCKYCVGVKEKPSKTYTRGQSLFNAAHVIINGERQTTYGDPEDSFEYIAQRWGQYLTCRLGCKVKLSTADVAFMMADFKMARECFQGKRDNIVDAVGYLGIRDDMKGAEDAGR